MSNQLVIRNMTRPELDELVDWAAHEGWNPGIHDAELFWAGTLLPSSQRPWVAN